MPMPAQPFGWFKKNVTKVADVKGMKYRTVGLATNVLTAMGMVVRQLPGGEIQPAMKTGLIDAAEFNNPTSDSQFGMQDVSKHYHLGSFAAPTIAIALNIPLALFIVSSHSRAGIESATIPAPA